MGKKYRKERSGQAPTPTKNTATTPTEPTEPPEPPAKRGLWVFLPPLLALIGSGTLLVPYDSTDPDVLSLSTRFTESLVNYNDLTILGTGELKRDRDTLFWSRFSDQFGSNPNTP
jgi:hypothetical protein